MGSYLEDYMDAQEKWRPFPAAIFVVACLSPFQAQDGTNSADLGKEEMTLFKRLIFAAMRCAVALLNGPMLVRGNVRLWAIEMRVMVERSCVLCVCFLFADG